MTLNSAFITHHSLLRLEHVDAAAAAIEFYVAVDQGGEGGVVSLTPLAAGMVTGASLPKKDMSRPYCLAAKALYAATLGIRIATVAAGALTFFICHGNHLKGSGFSTPVDKKKPWPVNSLL